eukprot:CAMPEP_0183485704 /NCGR_PEP_ID=MMETSP0370-20130417/179560_1 /TAXON_ID=268820 /ORGANISM="Peridinium aciculiferum, Strain PAER-2" /LENGTH=423 /DNA_ID=CAMNT_0025679009 /DNA_START=96 /DNA_END=1368 /DNA_ORIENTATION=-
MSSTMQRRSSSLLPAAVACSVLGGQLFVPAVQGPITAATRLVTVSSASDVSGMSPTSGPRSAIALGSVATVGACMAGLVGRRLRTVKTSRAAYDPALEEGATDPLGFFDPLGFTKGKDAANFRKFRVAETKHGRVAMMASIGTVVSHSVKIPGFEKVPAGLGAITDEAALPGIAALFVFSGLLELVLWKDDANKDPGNFGDPLSWAESVNVDRSYELNNGRMAMIAVLGQFAAELVTGQDAVEQISIVPALVMNAAECEIFHGSSFTAVRLCRCQALRPCGVQYFTTDLEALAHAEGNFSTSSHLWVSLASFGALYLLIACSHAPQARTCDTKVQTQKRRKRERSVKKAALFVFSGLLELVLWKDDANKDPGNFGDPLSWGESINVERSYELNNGRMAMLAVLGQFVAELVTGKDAVEQLGLK